MKRAIALCLSLFIILSFGGCKKGEDVQSTFSDTVSQISSESEVSSENGDSVDPENIENGRSDGAPVTAEKPIKGDGEQNGIDVSRWQGEIDWGKVAKSGIDFAIIRIGYRGENGVIYKDPYADYNLSAADAAGILTGVYFFSTAKTVAEAIEEADFTLSQIAGYSISYPVVYDCEGYTSPNSRMYGVSAAVRTNAALAFTQRVSTQGYNGFVYASLNDLQDSVYYETERLEANCGIWIAHYPSVTYPKVSHPDYNGEYDMWQYTNRGSVSGVGGNCDLIVSYFTRTKAAPKNPSLRPNDTSAPKEEDKNYKIVSETVTAKDVVNLRSGAGTGNSVVGQLKNGETAKRTAVGTNGWSRLEWNGQTVYAISSYLTTDLSFSPPVSSEPAVQSEFTAASGQLTAKNETNLREKPSVDSAVVAVLKSGDFLERTGVSAKGWTRLNYNGQTVYAVSSLLSETVQSSEPTAPTPEFEEVSDSVTAKSETNLRTAPSTTDSEVVYTLKNGEYVERTGKSSKGWSRLNYNGQTVYAVTSYLIEQ